MTLVSKPVAVLFYVVQILNIYFYLDASVSFYYLTKMYLPTPTALQIGNMKLL